MARPRKSVTMEIVSVRLPRSMVAEVDRVAQAMQEEMPLLSITRADAIRVLIAEGVEARAKAAKQRRGARRSG